MKHLKKGLAIGVILLFIGIAVSPSVTADKDRIPEFKPSEVNYKQLLKRILNLKIRIGKLSSYDECGCDADVETGEDYPWLICGMLFHAIRLCAWILLLVYIGVNVPKILQFIAEYFGPKLADLYVALGCP